MGALRLTDPGGARGELDVEAGTRLSEAIWLSGLVAPAPLCGGAGLCGRCKIRYFEAAPEPCAAEIAFFDTNELAAGWRLACRQTMPKNDLRIGLAVALLPRIAAKAVVVAQKNAVLGIDLGTTSIQWAAVEPRKPAARLAGGSFLNPQAGAGPDIISRVACAMKPGGEKRLSELVREKIAALVANLAREGIAIKSACVAANSAMTEILLEKDVSGLAAAPYRLATGGGESVNLRLPGLAEELAVLIPPLPAPFVGGDIAAGLLAIPDKTPPFILADLGTNAELALLDAKNRLYLASAPLGPALEGIGPACGRLAGPGAITGFSPGPQGLVPRYFDASAPTDGICATGYLSLLALLPRLGLMTENGEFVNSPPNPLAAKIAAKLRGRRLALPDGLYLTAADVEIFLQVKAALAVSFQRLFAAAKLTPGQIKNLWLAGALGEYSSPDDLATPGFIPANLAEKTRPCGNSSLAGALELACFPQKLEPLTSLCARAEVLQLAEDPNFFNDYIGAMRWGGNAAEI